MNSEHESGANQKLTRPERFPFFNVGAAVVVFVVLILVALNLAETKKNRAQRECISNLQQIDGVSQAWALENKKAVTDTYSLTDTTMLMYLKASMLPVCPLGGTYSPGTNHGDVPKCSVPGHRLLYPTPMGGYVR